MFMENKKVLIKKSYVETNTFVESHLKEVRDNGLRGFYPGAVDCTRHPLGQQFTLTGAIFTKIATLNGVKYPYIALGTQEGRDLSLANMMGISSLKGIDLNNEVEVNYLDNGKMATRHLKSTVIDGFDFYQVWQPRTRLYLELAAMIAEKDLDLTNVRVTYLGCVVKPFIAKISGEDIFGERYEQGYKRAMEYHLWKLDL